ncbi:hypothetical protein L579_4295 [Pantoea sp. AS-PWVM4]|uniref:hypothetical protein n=1 Tax=Pantoea sp. AS-PWVM4 TaxID=1332069 RepID=UPI0003AC5D4C|nr:hypothetical protein [Pantoea sp. AS-PWVM4]ERK16386.1 hypothetical protein L579_4295 [Pantoea sp. AS-PWVM4]
MQDELLYQRIGQIIYSCGPANASELFVKAKLFSATGAGEFEFDYLDDSGEPDWFEPDHLAVTDLSEALRELQQHSVESGMPDGTAIWSKCEITVNVAEKKIDIVFQYE